MSEWDINVISEKGRIISLKVLLLLKKKSVNLKEMFMTWIRIQFVHGESFIRTRVKIE